MGLSCSRCSRGSAPSPVATQSSTEVMPYERPCGYSPLLSEGARNVLRGLWLLQQRCTGKGTRWLSYDLLREVSSWADTTPSWDPMWGHSGVAYKGRLCTAVGHKSEFISFGAIGVALREPVLPGARCRVALLLQKTVVNRWNPGTLATGVYKIGVSPLMSSSEYPYAGSAVLLGEHGRVWGKKLGDDLPCPCIAVIDVDRSANRITWFIKGRAPYTMQSESLAGNEPLHVVIYMNRVGDSVEILRNDAPELDFFWRLP
eukprot:Sspe_Gene.51176::Locus_28424_Transcript_1_1_Confidence_1.000_Length_844::g.51176::m.51176